MQAMTEALRQKCRRSDVRYMEIRVEERQSTAISFRGPKLERLTAGKSAGGNVRVLVGDGWGFVSFYDLEQLDAAIASAVEQASLANRYASEPVKLAEVAPVVEQVPLLLTGEDPRSVSVQEKKELLAAYNERILSTAGVTSSQVHYTDAWVRVTFVNSEGTAIEQEKVDLGGNLGAIATRDGDAQQDFVSFGSSGSFDVLRGLEAQVDDVAQRAVTLLDAQEVQGRPYTVILDPVLAGVFVHEAFGHLSEGDNVAGDANLLKTMQLGKRFGRPILNIYDSGLDVGSRAYLKYDDEGVPTQKTYLLREGVLVGRLHSRETAGKLGEQPTGNARAINWRYPPIVRMRNTCIEAGTTPPADLFADVQDGIYAKGAYGGETTHGNFTFRATSAYRIRNGKLAEPLKNATLSGNLFETLQNIDAIGSDQTQCESGGGCGKGGQVPLPVAQGAPHIRIQNLLVGGAQ